MFYARPDGPLLPLAVEPRLASWMGAGHPDQIRLVRFLTHAEALLGPRLRALTGPLALRLDIGLPRSVALLDQHDLDNYLFPLTMALSRRWGRRFASVCASKRYADVSAIGVERALARPTPAAVDWWARVRTTASGGATAYKEQIRDRLAGLAVLPEGPVVLELAFTTGPRRHWPNLWKPTIDALDPILGSETPGRPWHRATAGSRRSGCTTGSSRPWETTS